MVSELSKLIGELFIWQASKAIHIECRIVDVREVWGRVQVLIAPLSGTGQQWVNYD